MDPRDVADEEQHLAVLFDRLEDLKGQARAGLDRALLTTGGSPQARSERESLVRLYSGEIEAYRSAGLGLYFGRLDTTDGEVHRIGRVGLRADDDDLTTLLLDWRAELARPFYLATTARPEGVRRRRHLRTAGRRVLALHDEILSRDGAPADPAPITGARAGDDPIDPGASDRGDVVGEAALLTALEAARTGHMTDIVATIQREQDEIIRHPHRGVLVVGGGPGTGKTAVALHRAAYLLYTHREQLDRSGVLIVGPNSTFLDYISRVLPSLGESGVVLRTLGDLYPGISATATDTLRGMEVKGSEAMVDILTAAVRARQLAPESDRTIEVDGVRLTISPALVRQARGRGRMSRKPHNLARKAFSDHLLDELTEQYCEVLVAGVDDAEAAAWQPSGDGVGDLGDPDKPVLDADDRVEVRAELAASAQLGEVFDEWWPLLTPDQVLAELLESPDRIAEAAADYVEEDQQALYRPVGAEFTPSDVPLLDELAELLGVDAERDRREEEQAWRLQLRQAEEALEILTGSADQEYEDEDDIDVEILAAQDVIDAEALARRHRVADDESVAERAAADRSWAYGHVIVDEAQELSFMAWRMLMRRSPNRWMTIVGDPAQTSSPAGVDDWGDALSPYVEDRWRLCELTVNYRTPATISDVAARLLAEFAPGLSSPRPVREGRTEVAWLEPEPGDLAATAIATLAGAEPDRAVALLVPDDHPPAAVADLRDRVTAVRADAVVSTLADAKGLEFDVVCIVEPDRIVARSPQGMQDLYVGMTRATQELALVQPGGFSDLLRAVRAGARPTAEHKERIA